MVIGLGAIGAVKNVELGRANTEMQHHTGPDTIILSLLTVFPVKK
ncbi:MULTISPECIES: hypothetical protein [Oceanobacillus]|uniref:Uncharacterized protein n=1 Tax=Oceanobacillus indicireducens TaxID=1004261 RepID=A0A917XXP9_9BACI|nr:MULTISPECIES: hypothetical protein [Oceanobacillus]GGN55968.1 hypothetical protein GCM10007971_15310 [Oceanobacillus indicireducens]